MTLLKEIIKLSTHTDTSTATLLRHTRILATRLGHARIKEWVDHELNGYPSKDDLPPYRVINAGAYGTFQNIAYIFNKKPLPPAVMEKDLQFYATTAYLTQPVAAYDELVGKGTTGEGLRISWPSNLILHYQEKFIEGAALIDAWQEIPRSSVIGMLDRVRNSVLTFALEIEAESPNAGELAPSAQELTPEQITQHFTTIVMGNVGSVVANAAGASITVNNATGDLDGLAKLLRDVGIEDAEIRALKQAVAEDGTDAITDRVGPKVEGWLTKIGKKLGSASLKAGTEIVTTVLSKAISRYYGLE